MSVFRGEMKQGRSPLFIFHFGELPDEIPGVLCRHLSIIFPFKAGEIGGWHRYLVVRNTPYRLVPWAGVWYERKSLKRIGSSETSCLAKSPVMESWNNVRVGWSNQLLFLFLFLFWWLILLWASCFRGFLGGMMGGLSLWIYGLNEWLG